MSYHTIPVPFGYDPLDAMNEINTFGHLHNYHWWSWRHHWPFRTWAVIEVKDDA